MRFLLSLVIFCGLMNPASAVYPSAYIKIKNGKHLLAQRIIQDDFLNFLNEKPKILLAKDKNHKDDLFCKFQSEVNSKDQIILGSLKLLKSSGNINYDLRCIEFLREHPLLIKKRNNNKPIQLRFIYLAF